MNLDAEDVARLAYNSMQFVNVKSLYLPNQVLFVINSGSLRVYACDDYIAISDTAELNDDSTKMEEFAVNLQQLKELEKFARTNKKSTINISQSTDATIWALGESEETYSTTHETIYHKGWDHVDSILFDKVSRSPSTVYSIRPERVANLSKLKAAKEAPLDFCHFDYGGDHLIRFRLGLTLTGCIRPVAREEVNSEYLWEG